MPSPHAAAFRVVVRRSATWYIKNVAVSNVLAAPFPLRDGETSIANPLGNPRSRRKLLFCKFL
jgi:hypothetical protein